MQKIVNAECNSINPLVVFGWRQCGGTYWPGIMHAALGLKMMMMMRMMTFVNNFYNRKWHLWQFEDRGE